MPKPKTKKIFKALVIAAVLAFVIIKSQSRTTDVRIILTDTSAPALNSFHSLLLSFKRILPFAAFREENRLLKDRIDLLTRKMDEARSVYDENQRLKTLLDFTKSIPYATIPAQVIGRDPTNWSNTLVIDKGSSSGISRNKAALSTKGLVGRVVEVGRRSSKILLITDMNSKAGVLIQRTRHGGILTGMADGRCKMVYISLDADVRAGDKVITAGFGSVFPKGILVGEVVKSAKEPGRLYKYAVVEPSEDLSKLEEVLCIR